MISVTPQAKEKLEEYLRLEPVGTTIRVLVEAEAGKFGLLLDARTPKDEAFTVEGIPFVVEKWNVPALEGLKIDYETQGSGGFSLSGGKRLVKAGGGARPNEPIALRRDCEAIVIPAGDTIKLAAGTNVVITQALGGSTTVMVVDQGVLARIAAKDVDALGLEVPAGGAAEAVPTGPLIELVWGQLRKVYDPEIPVNVADLGLVYGCVVAPHKGGGNKVEIRMTLTAPGCGMGETLKSEVEDRVGGLPGVKEVAVELVWEPTWDRSMMSEAAKLQLGML